jgi:hypothetical protein
LWRAAFGGEIVCSDPEPGNRFAQDVTEGFHLRSRLLKVNFPQPAAEFLLCETLPVILSKSLANPTGKPKSQLLYFQ